MSYVTRVAAGLLAMQALGTYAAPLDAPTTVEAVPRQLPTWDTVIPAHAINQAGEDSLNRRIIPEQDIICGEYGEDSSQCKQAKARASAAPQPFLGDKRDAAIPASPSPSASGSGPLTHCVMHPPSQLLVCPLSATQGAVKRDGSSNGQVGIKNCVTHPPSDLISCEYDGAPPSVKRDGSSGGVGVKNCVAHPPSDLISCEYDGVPPTV